MSVFGMVACSALLLVAATAGARGEVSARLDNEGHYLGMYYKYSWGNPPKIWAASAPTATRRPLNPTGDLLGDLMPMVAENPTNLFYPLAVWSHPNGGDYDLVFSRWTGSGWTPLQFVQTDNFTNEYDPRVGFNSRGRPLIVWWSEDSGSTALSTATVWFSMFLETRWMTPVVVSGVVDSRRPDLTIVNNTTVIVTFDTPSGRQSRTLTLPDSETITDDVDPRIRSEISIQ
jgi:hypothetical protein